MHTHTPSGGCARLKSGSPSPRQTPLFSEDALEAPSRRAVLRARRQALRSPGHGVEPFRPVAHEQDGPGFSEEDQAYFYGLFQFHQRDERSNVECVRVRMARTKKDLQYHVQRAFNRQNLAEHDFLRLHGPRFTLFMEIEVDLLDNEDLQERLHLLDRFGVQPNLELYRVTGYSPKDSSGTPRPSKLGSCHLLWLLEHPVIWNGELRDVECADGKTRANSAWSFYKDVWAMLNETFGGDPAFKIHITRNPFRSPEGAEYVTHCIHREPTSLLALKTAARQALTEREETARALEELQNATADDAKKGRGGTKGRKRPALTRGTAMQIDGERVLAPLVDDHCIILRNESVFDAARFHGYALGREAEAQGAVLTVSEVERSVLAVARRYNAMIPAMVKKRPSLAAGNPVKAEPLTDTEVQATARQVAQFVVFTYMKQDGGDATGSPTKRRSSGADYTPEQRSAGGRKRQRREDASDHQSAAGRASGAARQVPRRTITRIKKMLRAGTSPAGIKRVIEGSPRTVDRYIAQARQELREEAF